jgi:hypothetical protein
MNALGRNGIIIFLFLSLVVADSCKAQNAAPLPQDALPNVIIITMSGVRNLEVFEDKDDRYFPHLKKDLLEKGTLYNNVIDRSFEFHMPSVNAINTGRRHPYHVPYVLFPTIFQLLISQKGLLPEQVWFVGTWFPNSRGVVDEDYSEATLPCFLSKLYGGTSQLEQLLNDEEWQQIENFQSLLKTEFWPHWDSIGTDQYTILKRIFKEFKPKLVHYVMGAPETAHYGSFGRYINSLVNCDQRIYEIFQYIQGDPFYKDNTYLFVSADHERNLYYMSHGEKQYDDSTRVWLYVFGPDIKKGATITREIRRVDMFKTIADIFGLMHPPTEGKNLRDCFEDDKAPFI